MKIYDVNIPAPAALREALGLNGYKWSMQAELKELLVCAFPLLDANEMKTNLKQFVAHGNFARPPALPTEIYQNYKLTYGCSLPFDDSQPQIKPKYAVKDSKMDDIARLKEALLNELQQLQDRSNYCDEAGNFDQIKAEALFKRAEAVSNLTGQLNELNRTEIDAKRVQLSAVKLAIYNGYTVAPQALGLEQITVKKNG